MSCSPQRRVTYVADNDVDANHFYIVTVLTGMGNGASTKATISIRLKGEKGKGMVHVLADNNIELFQIGAEDLFVVAEKTNLGRINEVSVWVDYSNTAPAW